MDLHLNGRVAVVTGASSGIGEAVARSLAAEGATVAVAARRTDRLQKLAQSIEHAGGAASAFTFDQTTIGSGAQLIRDVMNRFGKIDILVANGGGPKAGTYLQTPIEEWDRAYGFILRSMLELVNEAVPHMRENNWGRIVALTSMTVKEPIPTLVLSNSLRTALVSALKTLSLEVGEANVTVNSIATGRILTERLLELYDNDEAALLEAARRDVPLRRPGTPDEFAPMVTFLCSEHARYITGQTIAIDGGLIKSLL